LNSIRPKSTVQPGEMRSVKKLAITTFQGTTLIFSGAMATKIGSAGDWARG
jgi:hypothetical protein